MGWCLGGHRGTGLSQPHQHASLQEKRLPTSTRSLLPAVRSQHHCQQLWQDHQPEQGALAWLGPGLSWPVGSNTAPLHTMLCHCSFLSIETSPSCCTLASSPNSPPTHPPNHPPQDLEEYNPADMVQSLCRMISYNIGQLAYLNAKR